MTEQPLITSLATMTNYKQLCAELVAVEDALMGGAALVSNQGQALDGYAALAAFRDVANRARDALAESQPEGPTADPYLENCSKTQALADFNWLVGRTLGRAEFDERSNRIQRALESLPDD